MSGRPELSDRKRDLFLPSLFPVPLAGGFYCVRDPARRQVFEFRQRKGGKILGGGLERDFQSPGPEWQDIRSRVPDGRASYLRTEAKFAESLS
jgi:hypothetical protein